jgi:DNA-binding beta-propeller fold protein YncE
LIWPAGIALDRDNVYVTDEWLNRVSIFNKDGAFLRDWGTAER